MIARYWRKTILEKSQYSIVQSNANDNRRISRYIGDISRNFTLNDISNNKSLELLFYFSVKYHVALRDIVSCQRFIVSALRYIIPALRYIVSASRYIVSALRCIVFACRDIVPVYHHGIVKYTYTSLKII